MGWTIHQHPPLPDGYYGNSIVSPAATATVESLSKSPFHYAVELVRKTKTDVTEEYIKSAMNLLATRGRPYTKLVGTYVVSDIRHLSFKDVDFGWGKAVYGGPAKCDMSAVPGLSSVYVSGNNNKGENGIAVPITLPANAMEVFAKELETMVKK